MLVLDEIGTVLELGLLSEETVIELLAKGRSCIDMVLTGRSFPDSVIDKADMGTRM